MVWTAEQARRFLAFAERERLFALYRLAMLRDPRRGELLGLRWADVDLGKASALIRETCNGGPKTEAGHRHFGLDAGTVAALREWRGNRTGSGWRPG
jgi:integrase